MSIHANTVNDFGHGFGLDTHRVLTLPGEVVAQAEGIVTNNGRTTVGAQLLQTALVLGFVSELFVVFLALGW